MSDKKLVLKRATNNATTKLHTPRGRVTRKAYFPRTPKLANRLRSASLEQAGLEHQRLVLNYSGRLTLSQKASKRATGRMSPVIKAGDPVKFTWSIGKKKSSFVGYVFSVKATANTSVVGTTVVCLGASKALRKSRKRVFKNVTASDVATTLAKEARLKPVVHKTRKKHASIVQAGITDWQLLRKLANETGYGMFVNNTTLYFIDIDTWLSKKIKESRVFKFRQNVPGNVHIGQSLYSWRPNVPESAFSDGDGGEVGLAVGEEDLEDVSIDFDYMDEPFTIVEVDEVELPFDYGDTYEMVPETTVDELVDLDPVVIEPPLEEI